MRREKESLSAIGCSLDKAVVGGWFGGELVRKGISVNYRRGKLAGMPETTSVSWIHMTSTVLLVFDDQCFQLCLDVWIEVGIRFASVRKVGPRAAFHALSV